MITCILHVCSGVVYVRCVLVCVVILCGVLTAWTTSAADENFTS